MTRGAGALLVSAVAHGAAVVSAGVVLRFNHDTPEPAHAVEIDVAVVAAPVVAPAAGEADGRAAVGPAAAPRRLRHGAGAPRAAPAAIAPAAAVAGKRPPRAGDVVPVRFVLDDTTMTSVAPGAGSGGAAPV
ncbi:MAG: hypothetical protein ABUS79_21965, partial [Pseudomonadota bacterium]